MLLYYNRLNLPNFVHLNKISKKIAVFFFHYTKFDKKGFTFA